MRCLAVIRWLCLAGVLSLCVGASCGQSAIGILPGVINDPRNLSLRRALLAYGTGEMCAEMTNRSVPLRLRDEDPAAGRFYPNACVSQELQNRNLLLQFGGRGHVWTNLTRRMSFDATGAVEYEHDFLLDGRRMYVYFRPKATTAAQFSTRMIEQPAAASVVGIPGMGGQSFTDSLGGQLMKTELARGFTVLRHENGTVEFGIGVVEKGARPSAPFRGRDDDRVLLTNERTEVQREQRDYVGPLEVPRKGQAFALTMSVDGAAGIDVILVPRGVGESWLQGYHMQPGTTPPPALPLLDEPVSAGAIYRRTVPLPKGQYYLVLDNTSTAGRTHPPQGNFDDRAAHVSFAIELVDAP